MICKNCGSEFVQKSKYHVASFCCRKCSNEYNKNHKDINSYIKYNHICKRCGVEFLSSRKKVVYCSEFCSKNRNIFIIEGEVHKKCSVCKKIKIREDNFYKMYKNVTGDGYQSKCIQCGLDYKKTDRGREVGKRSRIKRKDKAWKVEMIRRQRPEVKQARSAQEATQRVVDDNFALRCRMRMLVYAALRRTQRSRKLEEMIGYSAEDLRVYIKKLLAKIDGMSWELLMQGKIHIDHKIPASKFNYVSVCDEDFKKCWSLDNLQPMWGSDNLEKGNREDFA
jgi:hypothetical protein